jgi:aminomethyltransferase
VKLDKGEFRGRDALRRRREDARLRRRVGLELSGKRIAREGSTLRADGRDIGTVTSGTFAPTLHKSIAMAYVDQPFTARGKTCVVDIRGKEEPASIVPLPFYKRVGNRE